MTTMKNNNDFLIGALLIAGAFWYSKQSQARSTVGAPTTTRPPLGTGSMPGTVGSGPAQVVGGAIGSMLTTIFGRSTTPITSGGNYYDYLTNPNYIANQVRSEQAWDQQTPDVYVPGSSSTTGEDQIWTVG